MSGRRVLITGVGSYLGTLLAARLERDPGFDAVFGLDTRRPRRELERTELIQADIRDHGITPVVARAEVDTVVHNSIVRSRWRSAEPSVAWTVRSTASRSSDGVLGRFAMRSAV